MEMPRPFEPRLHAGLLTHEGPCDLAHLAPARVRWWLRAYSARGGMLRQFSWWAGLPYQRLRNLAYGQARTVRCDEALRVSQRVYDDTVLYSAVSWRARPLGFPQWVREQSRKSGLGRPPASVTHRAGLDLVTAARVARLRVPDRLTPEQTHELGACLSAGGWTRRSVQIEGRNTRRWFPPALLPTLPL